MNTIQDQFIHIFIPGGSPESPTLLLLHGTGGNEAALLEVGKELLPGANLLGVRGKVLEHGMPRFFRRLSEGVFDLEDLHIRTGELHDFINAARIEYNLTKSPIIAVGYSNGANIAASVLMSYPGTLQGAVLFRPMLPFELSEIQKVAPPIPVLIISGEHDHLVRPQNVQSLEQSLRSLGMQVDVHWLPTGHQLGYTDIVYAREWLGNSFQ